MKTQWETTRGKRYSDRFVAAKAAAKEHPALPIVYADFGDGGGMTLEDLTRFGRRGGRKIESLSLAEYERLTKCPHVTINQIGSWSADDSETRLGYEYCLRD